MLCIEKLALSRQKRQRESFAGFGRDMVLEDLHSQGGQTTPDLLFPLFEIHYNIMRQRLLCDSCTFDYHVFHWKAAKPPCKSRSIKACRRANLPGLSASRLSGDWGAGGQLAADANPASWGKGSCVAGILKFFFESKVQDVFGRDKTFKLLLHRPHGAKRAPHDGWRYGVLGAAVNWRPWQVSPPKKMEEGVLRAFCAISICFNFQVSKRDLGWEGWGRLQ